MTTAQLDQPSSNAGTRVFQVAAWAGVVMLALYFVAVNGLHYLAGSELVNKVFPDSVPLIRLHIFAGMGALFGGLLQFRTGPRATYRRVHRWVGRAYLFSVGMGAASAAVLVSSAHGNWVYASGLAALAITWVSTSILAYAAIRRGSIAQHREWMMRSYVVTFGFVTFRLLTNILVALHIGTRGERQAFASWFCWAAPLFVAELFLQGKKIFAGRAPSDARRVTHAESRAPSDVRQMTRIEQRAPTHTA